MYADVYADGFYIPENVVIIGTMNDIDRSVDSMDFALRRRFEWREFEVTVEMLRSAFTAKNEWGAIYGDVICENAQELAERIMKLNEESIKKAGERFGLNEQYYISQGQFANIPPRESLEEVLAYVWNYRIESLLKEYLRGEDGVERFLEEACRNLTGKSRSEVRAI